MRALLCVLCVLCGVSTCRVGKIWFICVLGRGWIGLSYGGHRCAGDSAHVEQGWAACHGQRAVPAASAVHAVLWAGAAARRATVEQWRRDPLLEMTSLPERLRQRRYTCSHVRMHAMHTRHVQLLVLGGWVLFRW